MGKIISVHSYRGGTGKSNMTANLATTLAMMGYKVGVVDTDIQSPGIHIIFQLEEDKITKTLNDYLREKCPVEETAYDITPSEVQGKGSIHLIPSSMKANAISLIIRDGYDVGLLSDGIRELIRHYEFDYFLIDTHPGLNEETLLSITISDRLVLILRPDHQDFQGTAVTAEVARKLGIPKMVMVVNKALPALDRDKLREKVENSYGAPVAGILPLSEEMVQLGSSGVFCLKYPDHFITAEIKKIVQELL